MMRCDDAQTYLDDYADGELGQEQRLALEEHLEACPQCREQEQALRTLLDETRALPESITAERDLWPGIESRIEGKIVHLSAARRRRAPLPVFRYALAAAVVIAMIVSAGIFRSLPTEEPHETRIAEIAEGEQREADQLEKEYGQAKEERQKLLKALREVESSLPPGVLATIEENLEVIEKAVLDIRTAMADEPNNPLLERMLIATYRSEVALLHQAVRFANRS